jgi:Elongation factor Tu C-terminal domain
VNNVPVRSALTGQCITVLLSPGAKPAMSSGGIVNPTIATPSRPSLPSVMTPSGGRTVEVPLNDTSSCSRHSSPSLHARKSPVGLVMLGGTQQSDFTTAIDIDPPFAVWEFEASIQILNHPGVIKTNYEPVVLISNVTQSCRIMSIRRFRSQDSNDCDDDDLMCDPAQPISGVGCDELCNGDKAACRFRFLFRPEYVQLDSRVVLREGRTIAFGTITNIYKGD